MRSLLFLLCLIISFPAFSQESVGPRFSQAKVMPQISRSNAIVNAKERSKNTVGLMNQLSRDTIGATELHQLDVTGKGVVICVVDVGIDFNHKAFTDLTGVNHVKRAMIYPMAYSDTLWNESHTDWRWNYQLAQTPEEIAQLTTDNAEEVHGTHTSASAGGARQMEGTENSNYYGMAPDADLFLVGNPTFSTEYTLDAFQHAKEYAQSVGKPLVCSYSVGNTFIPLDTLEYWPRALRQFTEDGNAKGLAICVSAGNSGSSSDKQSVHWDFADSDSKLIHKTVLGHPNISDTIVDYSRCYFMFYDITKRNLECQLSIVDALQDTIVWQSDMISTSIETECDIMENTPFSQYGTVYISFGEDPDNHLKCAYIQSLDFKLPYKLPVNDQPADSCYLLTVTVKGEPGGFIEGKSYPASQYGTGFYSGTDKMSDYEEGDAMNALNSFCANPWCISVGASDATQKGGNFSAFTSYGYDFYGNPYPEVLAPGVGIMSAVNRYNTNPENLTLHSFDILSGTSMATPITAGMIACWMQENPELTIRQIHEIIAATSYVDPALVANAPDPSKYGYGTLQGMTAFKKVQEMKPTSIDQIMLSMPQQNKSTFNLFGIATDSKTGLMIRNGKIILMK